MEAFLAVVGDWTRFLVPALALWAVFGIHVFRGDHRHRVFEVFFFAVMLIISVLTLRTIRANDPFWLVHTASLGLMIIAGVLQKKESSEEPAQMITG